MIPQRLPLEALGTQMCTTGCPVIDLLLLRGVPCYSVTEIVGESGSGKTQLCLQLSLSAQLPISRGGLSASSLYLHTEFPFPFRRLHQLSGAFYIKYPEIYSDYGDNPCDHVYVRSVHSTDHLLEVMPKIELFVGSVRSRLPVRLIIIDSIAALFRSEFDNTPSDLKKRSSLFFKIAAKLKELAMRFGLAVVVTNQVVDLVGNNEGVNGLRVGNLRALLSSGRQVCPALGLAWANCVNSRLFLSRNEEFLGEQIGELDENGSGYAHRRVRRHLHVVFSPHLPGSSCEFMITKEGVFGVS